MTRPWRIEISSKVDAALARARSLLRDGENELPEGVRQTVEFFVQRAAWFQLSRNPEVMSCRDAARRRSRLGHIGISLADELRSYLAQTADECGRRTFVLLHCRGDAAIDFETAGAIDQLAGLSLSKARVEELAESALGYGLINPFVAPLVLKQHGRVLQVFDPTILDGSGETGTMMTNAGDKSWAVEFDPRDLFKQDAAPLGIVAPIIAGAAIHEEDSRVIGILTGNAPESGALLWRKINRLFRARRGEAFRGDVSYPKVIIHSLPAMGWSMELSSREEKLLASIRDEVAAMGQAGVQVLAFACNTTQFLSPMIRDITTLAGMEFVDLQTPIKELLQKEPAPSTFAAGIGHVTNPDGWSAFPFLYTTPHITIPSLLQSKLIEDLAYQVKRDGVTGKSYQKFRAMIRHCKEDRCLLLLTELSLIFEKFPRLCHGSTQIIDSMDLYADKIVGRAIARL